jgi:ABC-type transport system involved in multi-copper enzyme maturation permease subunit
MTEPLFALDTNTILTGLNAPGYYAVYGCLALIVAGLVVFRFTTGAGVIAYATTKEAVRQPLFLMVIALSGVLLAINTWLPFFSLGDDIKMLKDVGLATILVAALLTAVWTASTSVTAEIEGKTAMTLLSKPINRRQFILGKFVGIYQAILLLVLALGLLLLFLVYYKVGYDAKEGGGSVPDWFSSTSILGIEMWALEPTRAAEAFQMLPGILLVGIEAGVLTALSVAIATRLPMVVNLTACLTIFIIGHLTPVLVQAEPEAAYVEVVQFVAQLIATVLPVLEYFKIEAAVATGSLVPAEYLGWSLLYGTAYTAAAILLGFILFEDRDLA